MAQRRAGPQAAIEGHPDLGLVALAGAAQHQKLDALGIVARDLPGGMAAFQRPQQLVARDPGRSGPPAGRGLCRGVLAHRINPSRRSSARSAAAAAASGWAWAPESGWAPAWARGGRGRRGGRDRGLRRAAGSTAAGLGAGAAFLCLTLRSRSAGIAEVVFRLATDTEAAGTATARGGAACGSVSRPARPAANSAPNDARASTSTSVSWRMPVISWGTWWPWPGLDTGTAACGRGFFFLRRVKVVYWPIRSGFVIAITMRVPGRSRRSSQRSGRAYPWRACWMPCGAGSPCPCTSPSRWCRRGADAEKVDAHRPDAGEAHHPDHGPGRDAAGPSAASRAPRRSSPLCVSVRPCASVTRSRTVFVPASL